MQRCQRKRLRRSVDAAQAASLEMCQEAAPPGLVLLGALDDAENLAVAVGVDRDRHQQRDVPPSRSPLLPTKNS
jgi:hypothetical protein